MKTFKDLLTFNPLKSYPKNNRKSTRGRRVQVIYLKNGRTKQIRHSF